MDVFRNEDFCVIFGLLCLIYIFMFRMEMLCVNWLRDIIENVMFMINGKCYFDICCLLRMKKCLILIYFLFVSYYRYI